MREFCTMSNDTSCQAVQNHCDAKKSSGGSDISVKYASGIHACAMECRVAGSPVSMLCAGTVSTTTACLSCTGKRRTHVMVMSLILCPHMHGGFGASK